MGRSWGELGNLDKHRGQANPGDDPEDAWLKNMFLIPIFRENVPVFREMQVCSDHPVV